MDYSDSTGNPEDPLIDITLELLYDIVGKFYPVWVFHGFFG